MTRVLLAALLGAALLPAQSSQEKGKRILQQTLDALGGDKFLAMKNRVESGRVYSFYREDLTGLAVAKIYTRYDSSPAPAEPGKLRVRERHAYGKEERAIDLFLEDAAYRLTYRGARPIPADRFKRYKESTFRNIFYVLHERLQEPGLIVESKGIEVIDNLPADVLHITDAHNNLLVVYIQQSTHLPMRQLFQRRDPQTKDRFEEVEIFSKYRDVGNGVQWPFAISRLRDGERYFQIFSESVQINGPLEDKLFEMPSGMKLLDK